MSTEQGRRLWRQLHNREDKPLSAATGVQRARLEYRAARGDQAARKVLDAYHASHDDDHGGDAA